MKKLRARFQAPQTPGQSQTSFPFVDLAASRRTAAERICSRHASGLPEYALHPAAQSESSCQSSAVCSVQPIVTCPSLSRHERISSAREDAQPEHNPELKFGRDFMVLNAIIFFVVHHEVQFADRAPA